LDLESPYGFMLTLSNKNNNFLFLTMAFFVNEKLFSGDRRFVDGQFKTRDLHDVVANDAFLRRFGFGALRRIQSFWIQK
jgi:hypothetical protein